MSPIVLIPARLASTRLPNKMLSDVGGLPMVVQSAKRAREADVGRVAVAAADQEIMDAVRDHGFEAVATDPAHPSGSDRIWEACTVLDPDGRHDVIVNVQGDNPTLDPSALRACLDPLADAEVDIATIAAPIVHDAEKTDPAAVKPIVSWRPDGRVGRALYFTRATAPMSEGNCFIISGSMLSAGPPCSGSSD